MWGRRVNRSRRVAAENTQEDQEAAYFRRPDERDSDPVFVQALTTSHPDTVLRRLGIIEQRGVYSRPRYGGLVQDNTEVYFDAQHVTWRRSEDHERLTDAPVFLGTQSLDKQTRTDRCAESLIQIFGNCENLPEVLSADTPDIVAIAQGHMNNITEHHKLTTEAANQVTDEITFSSVHQGMLLAQYLSRAIPTAAKNTNALIVCSPGNSKLAQHIGSGVASNRASRVTNSVTGTLQALAVTAYSDKPIPNGLCRDITHHVLLRRARVSRRPRCPQPTPKDDQRCDECGVVAMLHNEQCRGWAACPDDKCSSCGLEAHWHVAFTRPVRYLSSAANNSQETERLERLERILQNEAPDPFEVDMFVSGLVNTLSSGLREELDVIGRCVPKNDPVSRAPIPVCVVLFGGDVHTSRRYLAQCLIRRYKLLIVDGSGGYADKLWSLKKTIDHAFPNAGDDERRRYTVALDPLTAEILGNADLVRWIKKGTRIEELVRQIEGSLKGDRALLNAWETHALYAFNAQIFKVKYYTYTAIILFLGLVTTFLTVLQTFFLLNWTVNGETAPPVLPAMPDHRGVLVWIFWTGVQWMVVFLPLVISAIQSVLNKFSYGARWVELHTCAERLLSEIYTYRTSSLLYKREEVEKHSRPTGENGVSKEDLRVYTSREDLLQQKAREISNQLLNGTCKSVTLLQYKGPLPSKETTKRGDDGFSTLTPDQYVRFRLRHKVREFRESAARADILSSSVSLFIAVTSAVGTGLAAVAAYSMSSLLAWVPFTTALSNTAARLMDTFKWEAQQGKQDGCIRDLSSVAVIWASLRTRADLTKNRDLLVLQVESTILDEVDTWAQQMNSNVDRLAQQDMGADGRQRSAAVGEANKKQEQQDQQAEALKSIGFGELSVEKLSKILSDPLAAQSETADVHKKIEELKMKLKGADAKTETAKKSEATQNVLALASREMEGIEEIAKRRGEVTSVFSKLNFSGLGVADVLKKEELEILCAREVSETFIQTLLSTDEESEAAMVLHASNISQLELLTTLKSIKAVSGLIVGASPRRLQHIAKTMACAAFLGKLYASMPGFEREVGRLRDISRPFDRIEHIVSEMLVFGRTPRIEQFNSLLALLQVFSDPLITSVLAQESLQFTRELLKQIRGLLSSPVVKVIERVMFLIAQIDLDDMSKRITGGWKTGFQKLLQDIPLHLLSHRDQLSFLPQSLAPLLEGSSQLQLSFYLSQLIAANSSSGVAITWRKQWAEHMPMRLRQFFEDHEGAISGLFSSISDVDQAELLSLPRMMLLTRMNITKSDIGIILQAVNGDIVRLLLSSLKAMLSNTFGASTIDRTADDIRSIDLRRVLMGRNCTRFAAKVSELKFSDSLLTMPKEELLLLFGYPQLAEVFDNVSLTDLQDLFFQFGRSAMYGWAQADCGVRMRQALQSLSQEDNFSINGELVCRLTHFAVASFSFGSYADLEQCDDEMVRNNILSRFRNENPEAAAIAKAAFMDALRESAIDVEIGRVFCDALSQSGYAKEDLLKIVDGCRSWRIRQVIVQMITEHLFPSPIGMPSSLGIVTESIDSSGGSPKAERRRELFSLQDNTTSIAAAATIKGLVEIMNDQLVGLTGLQLSSSMTYDFLSFFGADREEEAYDMGLGGSQRQYLDPMELKKFWSTDYQSLSNLLSVPNETLLDYFTNVVLELQLSAPRRLFYDLAAACRFFDLRSLFPTLESRVDFVVGACYAISHNIVDFKHHIYSDAESVDCIAMGLQSEKSEKLHLERGKWRAEALKALKAELEPHGLILVVTVLHGLSEAQLRFLFELVRATMETTLGRFVVRRIRCFTRGGSFESLAKVFHVDLSLMSLVQAARREGRKFTATLDNLQFNKFVLRSEAERVNALARWVTAGGEESIRWLAKGDPSKFKSLFEMLQKALPDRDVGSLQIDPSLLLDNRMIEIERELKKQDVLEVSTAKKK
jgi:hypothetical protein